MSASARTGPSGPEGPAGADGAPGAAGSPGAPGADGAAGLPRQIQDHGTNVPVRATVDFEGDGVTVTDSGSKTTISVQTVDGAGVPDGGTTGQVLQKLSGTDGDADWRTPDVTQAELDAETSARTTAVSAEATARLSADSAEASARASADTTLQAHIDAEATARADADTTEATVRAAADTTLQGHIDSEATSRAAGDATNAAAAAAAQATADAALPKAGGTMTGKIVLDGDPTANLHPATKQWVVAQIVALINGAPGALDTLKEIDDQLAADESAVSALTSTVAGKLSAAANLSDLVNAVTARTNLGLGTAATHAVGDFDAAGAAAAAQAASQPLDSDLTAIAALTTAAFGLGLLTKTSAAAVLSYIGAAAASHTHAESDVTGLTADLAAKSQALTRTAVKTANYTAAPGDYVPVDTTAGSVTVTLPTAPADKSRIGVKQILRGGTNTVLIACGGSDTFNRAGGSTSTTLTLLAESAMLQYDSGSATWTIQANDAPLSQLDLRYATLAQGTDARTPTAHAASHASGGSDPITVAESQVTNLTTDLAAKAPLASPTLTGTPAAPTAAQGTNTTQVATTAYVQTEAGLLVPKSLVDAKGDLLIGTADNTPGRLAVGTAEQRLIPDTSAASGLRWADWMPSISHRRASAKAETLPRLLVSSTLTAVSGTLYLALLPEPLRAGVTYSAIEFLAGGTSLAGGTHQWFTLVRASDLTTLRSTSDDTSGAWTAQATKKLNLSSTYTPTVDVDVYLGVMVTATVTMPTFRGIATPTQVAGLVPILGGASNTGASTPLADGVAVTAITAGTICWASVS